MTLPASVLVSKYSGLIEVHRNAAFSSTWHFFTAEFAFSPLFMIFGPLMQEKRDTKGMPFETYLETLEKLKINSSEGRA
jgi:hypothetical protein